LPNLAAIKKIFKIIIIIINNWVLLDGILDLALPKFAPKNIEISEFSQFSICHE
jgi:hypothetical protein